MAQLGEPLPVYSQRGIIAATPLRRLPVPSSNRSSGSRSRLSRVDRNTVLRVEGDSVIVAMSRSPAGQPVPIEWVHSGREQLLETGEVEVSVPALGHRSSFVGGVLLTVPGAVLIRTVPPRIRLTNHQLEATVTAP
jgi:hypothetical protein